MAQYVGLKQKLLVRWEMKPTNAYLSTPERAKSRIETNSGCTCVVIENIDQQSFVYFSINSGLTWELIAWKRSAWALLSPSFYTVQWPPTNVMSIKSLTRSHLTILHIESRWAESDLYVCSTLCLKTKKWRIKSY